MTNRDDDTIRVFYRVKRREDHRIGAIREYRDDAKTRRSAIYDARDFLFNEISPNLSSHLT